jgi:hypothetical protein
MAAAAAAMQQQLLAAGAGGGVAGLEGFAGSCARTPRLSGLDLLSRAAHSAGATFGGQRSPRGTAAAAVAAAVAAAAAPEAQGHDSGAGAAEAEASDCEQQLAAGRSQRRTCTM